MSKETVKAWHFLHNSRRLQYQDGREAIDGETLSVSETPVLCKQGMHASLKVSDALRYAPGAVLCRVEVGGEIVLGVDKLAGQSRKVLWSLSAEATLKLIASYANWCADRARANSAYATYATSAADYAADAANYAATHAAKAAAAANYSADAAYDAAYTATYAASAATYADSAANYAADAAYDAAYTATYAASAATFADATYDAASSAASAEHEAQEQWWIYALTEIGCDCN